MASEPSGQNDYSDIIHLSHHISSRHPHMPVSDRAAQFSPFAALTGYGDVIRETARLTDRKPELSDEEKSLLDHKLHAAYHCPGESPEITITYFVPDEKKSGGAYHTAAGRIKKIDEYKHKIAMNDGTQIDIDYVVDIDEEIF